jgi:hypothetical protein
MSSATLTDATQAAPPAPADPSPITADPSPAIAAATRPADASAAAPIPADPAQPWHFFVVASLAAATLAVIVSTRTAPEYLVMISITVFAAGAAALATYHVVAPLVAERRRRRVVTAAGRAALLAEKALALRTIKELEFDRAMGKMSQADFEEMAGRLKARALRVMQQLDEAGSR